MVSDYKMVNEEERQAILSAETDEYKPAPPQRSYRGRIIACVVGFALLGAVFYATSSGNSTSLRKGNVGDSVQLSGADDSTWYLIRHDFKHDDDAAPWWENAQKFLGNVTAYTELVKAVAHAGWFNALFLPTAKKGPFFCVWQGRAGATKKDMADFINTNDLSPAKTMKNEVMPLPLELTGGKAPAKAYDLGRRLGEAPASTWFLIQHEFKHDDDAAPWWKKFQKLTSNATAIAGWSKAVAEVGWYNAVFMPTAKGGPFFCLWQGMAGATKEDMEDFINTNKLSPAGGMINTVMPIPLALVGGKPPVTPVGLGKVVYNVTDER
eukprot:CAMPEP_0169113144 /NCGR_PEP_ID=MMETSP1015-20121227/28037_1 /TAXON_ID=342587 /ORGANISM="Karlodinium micrum, Strain CCMP2283" /LENGTH=322 /DNA_ID=CAMNT_0009175279 /DNA_START=164 /DNA_END=1132 /DNA_ORIENTATION=+